MASEDILTLPAPPADARLAYGPDVQQFGELRLPADGGAGPHPVVVLLHGGYWRARYDLAYFGHAAADLTARGYATWNLEYRRVGNPDGGWPGMFLDVAAGMDHLRTLATQHPLDLDRVVLLGHSAGGHLALWLAARGRINSASALYTANPLLPKAVVSLAGVLDLRQASARHLSNDAVHELLGGPPEQYPERYAAASPAELLPTGVPAILIHGTGDSNVPYALSQDYADTARNAGDDVELVTLPGVGHFEIVDPRAPEWQTVAQAVERAAR
ncbi:MAG TPA: alpha/beta hydrolase [Ktedonobacterales bacterium]